MRITLSGDLGSGKSTIGARLSKQLGIPYISTGRIFREIGRISNMDALQTNLAAEDNADIDFAVDQRIKEIDKTSPHFIMDSRMAWHFARDATKIYLSVCPQAAASRIMADHSRTAENYLTLDDAMVALKKRRDSENKRYKLLYGVDIDDLDNYDLVIITDDANVDAIVTLVADIMSIGSRYKFWIPKTRLVPMISIRAAPQTALSARPALTDMFFIRLYVRRNFGFYFDNTNDLVNAFHYSENLIPYVNERPICLPEGEDVLEIAKTTLHPSSLYDWEKVGGVSLSFLRNLEARKATTAIS